MTPTSRRGPAVPLLLGAEWHDDQPGGLPRYFADLFDALRADRHHPRAVVVGPALAAPVGVAAAGHLDQSVPVRLGKFGATAATAGRGVDVVDAHFAFYAFLPVVLGPLRRLPLVVHFQGPWAQESVAAGEVARWRVGLKRRLEGTVYRRATTAVVLSEAFKRELVEGYGVDPWRVEVVAPGVDLERFTPGIRAEARDALRVDRDVPLVVTVRRLVPRMGLDTLIDAWAKAGPTLGEGARLLIVGDGPDRDRLQALAEAGGQGSTVSFLSGADDDTLVHCYRAADASVVPSTALEGFGLVVLESLACGTPVVVTDAGGMPEAVRGFDPSLVVPAGDADALAGRLTRAFDGTQPLPDGRRCRVHAERFRWTAVARRHAEIYERAAQWRTGNGLKVVYLDHCAQLSGGELALLRLLPGLEGVDAHVILGEDGPLAARLRDAGIGVEVLPMADAARTVRRDRVRPGMLPAQAAARTSAYILRLAARLRALRPDLVHTNSLKSALYGGAAARLAGVPVVWHVRDRISPDYLPVAAVRLVRAAARVLPDAVIANSAASLATLGPMPVTAVVPSPVAAPPPRAAPRPSGGPLRVGMVGRLAPWKGQHVFLEAFASAFPEGGAQAVVVGDALFDEMAYRSELHRRAGHADLSGRVDFLGFVDDVGDTLSTFDVLVHASTIPEPFGQVVVEGMAAGLAVVAAGAGGPAEVIEHGVNGLLYPPSDVASLASQLRRLAAEPALRHALGARAIQRAEGFGVDRVAPQVAEVYRRVLTSRRGEASLEDEGRWTSLTAP